MCAGEDVVQLFGQQGTCSAGVCPYASRTETCESASCSAGVCGGSKCEGVYCDKPPAHHCLDELTLVVFAPAGVCSSASGVAECRYASKTIPCQGDCEQGHCVEDPCLGVSCTVPPASYCNGHDLVVFESAGRCNDGMCVYTSRTEPCEKGCESGQCIDSRCTGVTCATGPAPHCTDGATLIIHGASSQCEDGVCLYGTFGKHCDNGCSDGHCNGDPCSGVSCNTPPANACISSTVLRAWDGQPGSCVDGACEYETVKTVCENGCATGQCIGDPYAGVTCSNPPADYCAGSNTLRRFRDGLGTCQSGSCLFQAEAVDCPERCEAGSCVGENVDEYAAGEHDCDPNATCTDMDPGYICECNPGFVGDVKTCTNNGECDINVGTPSCNDCFVAACTNECLAMVASAEYDSWIACAEACTDQNCLDACYLQYPEAGEATDLVQDCLEENCWDECNFSSNCNLSTNDASCDACFHAACSVECESLSGDGYLNDFPNCINGCNEAACEEACKLQYPGTGAAYETLLECVHLNCPDECPSI